MKNRHLRTATVALGLVFTALSLTAGNPVVREKKTADMTAQICASYMDSLTAMAARYRTWRYTGSDTLSNPYYFPLFASPTFYPGAVRREMGRLDKDTDNILRPSRAELVTHIDGALTHIYSEAPWLVVHGENDVEQPITETENFDREFRPQVNLTEKTPAPVPTEPVTDDFANDWKIVVRKPNFWTFSTKASLQLMQTHISDNWYKSGDSYNSWLVQLNFSAIYNNKQKVIFTNTLETKLGFVTSQDDSVHTFRTNSDLLRMTNKLGLQATKRWYYTFMLQSWTQFYRGLKSNNTYVYSDFMSPFESIFSVGMDYTLSTKKLSLSATLSPFACDFKYVDRKYLATSYGIDEGKHSDFSYGSNITVKYTWKITDNISWEGRLYYYTDYSKAQIEWENTFNLKINKILSTKLFLYPRFDDSVTRDEGESYFQFYEQLSFGLDVTF